LLLPVLAASRLDDSPLRNRLDTSGGSVSSGTSSVCANSSMARLCAASRAASPSDPTSCFARPSGPSSAARSHAFLSCPDSCNCFNRQGVESGVSRAPGVTSGALSETASGGGVASSIHGCTSASGALSRLVGSTCNRLRMKSHASDEISLNSVGGNSSALRRSSASGE